MAVTASWNDRGSRLEIKIETERLYLRSIKASEKDLSRCIPLFQDSAVKGWSKEDTVSLIYHVWGRRWNEGDPYSGFAIFLKPLAEGLKKQCIGVVALTQKGKPGESQVALLLDPLHQGRGYGVEVLSAMIEFAKEARALGYLHKGQELERITAIASSAQPSLQCALKQIGMTLERRYIDQELGVEKLRFALKV